MSVLSQFGPPVPYAALAGSVTNGVYTVGNQTIGGVKTFTSTIVGDISGNAGTANFATSAGSVTNGVYTIGNQTIGGIKTFTSTIVGDISGNAGTVTGGVYTTGNQTIGGTKTFSSTIVGDISGNAGTVTNGVYTTGNQTIGGTKTFSSTIVGDISGNAATATTATTATTASSVTNGVYTVGNQTIGGTKTFSVNPILSAGTVNAILTLDGSKQISAVSGLTWDSTKSNLSLGGITVGQGNAPLLNNTAFGLNALLNVTTGGFNIAIGRQALRSLTTGNRNTAMGDAAGDSLASGTDNTLIGVSAGALLNTGSNNTAIGGVSGFYITTGSFNTILGSFDGNQNSLDIRTTSNNIVLSDGAGNPRSYYDGPNNAWVWRTGASERMRLDSSGNVAFSAGTAAAPALTTIGDLDTGVFFPAANTWAVATGGSERMRITSAGNVVVGSTAAIGGNMSVWGGLYLGANNSTAELQNYRASDNSGAAFIYLNKARGTVASPTVVQSGDGLGSMVWRGYDGATYAQAAIIRAEVDGTPGSGDMPGRLVFSTTADGAASPTERMRIDSSGDVAFSQSIGVARFPSDFWATTGQIHQSYGYLGTQGGFAYSWIANGYRNSAGTWTTLSINGSDAAAGIELLTSTGTIVFRSDASKASGSSTTISERMRVDATGAVGIGTTSLTGYGLRVTRPITGSTSSFGVASDGTIQPDVTTHAQMFRTNTVTAANAGTPYTVASLTHYLAQQGTVHADSSITTQIGFSATSSLTSGTNVYGFYGNVTAATGRWNFFALGTAQNHFAGNTAIGTTSISARLTVRGEGTTSAANAVLAEDSAGTDLFVVRNDGGFAFKGGTVAVAQTGYTTPANLTTDRTFDANATTLDQLADVLGTLIEDLKAKGIISA